MHPYASDITRVLSDLPSWMARAQLLFSLCWPALEAQGAKVLVGGYSFGEYDVLVIFEALDDTTAASVALGVAAGGATRSAKTTLLLSGQEWIDSLRKVQGSGYQPAR
jgi:hypothetical protein